MFCRSCGARIEEGAKFCRECGTQVKSRQSNKQEPAALQENVSSAVQVHKDGTGDSAMELEAEQKPARAVGAKHSLKAKIIEFRRTTLRAVPTFVLAIVALLAAAGTAYAAYRVVKDVVIPAIEQVVQGNQENGGDTPAEDEVAGKEEENGPNKQAHEAYQQVLDEYRQLLSDHAEEIENGNEYGVPLYGWPEPGYQWAWTGDFYFTKNDPLYMYYDIDNDDVDELFITTAGFSSDGKANIVSAYDFENGQLVNVIQAMERSSVCLAEGDLLLHRASGGFDTATHEAFSWDGSVQWQGGGSAGSTVEVLSWYPADENDRGEPTSPYHVASVVQGEETTEVIEYSALQSLIDDYHARFLPRAFSEFDWQQL